jgi:hypothetical protein
MDAGQMGLSLFKTNTDVHDSDSDGDGELKDRKALRRKSCRDWWLLMRKSKEPLPVFRGRFF